MFTSRSTPWCLGLVLVPFLVVGCGETLDLTTTPEQQTHAVDLAVAGDSYASPFTFLPPLATDVRGERSFDGDRSPVLEICPDPGCEEILVRYATAEGEIEIDEEGEEYSVDWSLRATGIPDGGHFLLRVIEGDETLGTLEVVVGPAARGGPVAGGAARHPGMVVPIRFWLEAGAEDAEPVVGIGPEGGTVMSDDGRVTLVVPPDALSERTEITIDPSPLAAGDPGMVESLLYRFGPSALTFAIPAQLTIRYGGALPDGMDAEALRILRAGEAGWVQLPGVEQNAEEAWVRVELDGFSDYGVGAAQVDAVHPDPEALSLEVGEEALIALEITDLDGTVLDRSANWASSNAAIALVDSDGVVTATGVGQATVVAEVEGVVASVPVSVGGPDPIATTIEITPLESTLAAGESVQLTAAVFDEAGAPMPGAPVTWATSDPCAATVGPDGVVEALGGGEAMITAESGDAVGSATVEVLYGEPGAPESVAGAWKACTLPRSAAEEVRHIAHFELEHEAGTTEVRGTMTDPFDGSTANVLGAWRESMSLELSWPVRFQGGEQTLSIVDARPENQDLLLGTFNNTIIGQSFPVKLVRLR